MIQKLVPETLPSSTYKAKTVHGTKLLCFELGLTLCKAVQPLQGMKLQEKEAQSTKRLKHIGNLFRKNLQLIGV